MASTQKLTAEEQAIRDAQNDARAYLPPELDKRVNLIHNVLTKADQEKKAIEEAKNDVDLAGTKKNLITKYRLEPDALAFILKLEKKEPTVRARILGQVFGHAQDRGHFLKDLFDEGNVGTADGEADGQEAVFDKTANGRSRAATPAEPRSVEQMRASHTPEPTPGIPLEEALRRFEEENAKVAGKRGAKPKAWKEAKAALDAAKAAAEVASTEQGAASTEQGDADAEPGASPAAIPDLPEAAPGEVSAHMRETAAVGDAHIAEQVAKGAEPPKPDKPKRASRKKADTAAAAPPPAAEDPEPPAPPADDEDEDDTIDVSTLNAGGIGTGDSSYNVSLD